MLWELQRHKRESKTVFNESYTLQIQFWCQEEGTLEGKTDRKGRTSVASMQCQKAECMGTVNIYNTGDASNF